mgnify:FL=1
MSSSSIHSTVNATSSTVDTSQSLPSVFELLAQERLTDLIRPCLRQILKFLNDISPLSTKIRTLYRYKDEFILLIECIVQWFYLNSYSALVGEHFYGLKRTANHRLRSMIFSIFLPYVKTKLDSLHEYLSQNNTTTTTANRRARFYFILQILPKIEVDTISYFFSSISSAFLKLKVFIEGLYWLYRLGYAFGRTEYYSPALQLAGVKLIYAKEQTPVPVPETTTGRIFAAVSKVMSSGLFLIQFIDWWNSTNKSKQNSTGTTVAPPLPKGHANQLAIGRRQCPLCRQQCNVPTAVLGSGYVYCNACITDYVKRYHRCPTTHQPVTEEQLIKIY